MFPVAWTILYVLEGVALAIILHARGARGRGLAIALFVAQFVLSLAWTPVFFGAHRVVLALAIIAAMIVLAIAATLMFGRIRRAAAWLRSEEPTSELQSLMRISYAVFCLKKKKKTTTYHRRTP